MTGISPDIPLCLGGLAFLLFITLLMAASYIIFRNRRIIQKISEKDKK